MTEKTWVSAKNEPDLFDLVDRPCFIVLERWEDKRPPGLYHCWTKPGSANYPPVDYNDWISSPIHVKAITHDAERNNFGRMLDFKDSLSKSRQWSMPMELLKGDCSELRGILLDMGFEITANRKGRDKLPEYIQSQHPKDVIKCVTQTGWVNPHCFILPDKIYGAGNFTFQSTFKVKNEYQQSGNLEDWQENVSKLAIGNPMMIVAISTGLAAPLLDIVNAESGGIHFVGDSSTGKTTLLNAACSVWGSQSYKRSWRATANGLEGVATLFNDGFLALDEISECDPSEIGAIIYSLGNGQGKQRASRTGNARSVNKWRCMILSTGERTVETSMREGNRRIKAGQKLRLLDVNVECKHGVFDDFHGFETGAKLSEYIKQAAKGCHGVAGDVFLEKLVAYRSDDGDFAFPNIDASDGQHRRAANRFGLIALAGELASSWGITGWPKGAATQAAMQAFNRWRDAQPKGRNEEHKILEALQSFIEKHGESRFSDDWIQIAESPRAIYNRAGFKINGQYLFLSDGLREALQGFDFSRAKDVLMEKGILLNQTAKLQKIKSETFRVYEVNVEKLI